jgi:hypothetical protein
MFCGLIKKTRSITPRKQKYFGQRLNIEHLLFTIVLLLLGSSILSNHDINDAIPYSSKRIVILRTDFIDNNETITIFYGIGFCII